MELMENALEDEVLSINAIYSESTFEVVSNNPTICSLRLPGDSAIALRLEFPAIYPDAPPSILGTQSVGPDAIKGEGQHVVELARQILAQIYQPGSPCIYDLVEEVTQGLQQLLPEDDKRHQEQQDAQGHGQHGLQDTPGQNSDDEQSPDVLDKEPLWTLSDVVTEKRSVFVARTAAVSSPSEAKAFLHHLVATDKKVAKATHNITAWRIHGPNDTAFQDCDDDGETAAGGRLLHLMQLMDVWNVMVVVTRWYGGVQLGPDRFRIINSVARDALVKGGHIHDVKQEGKNEAAKKKGKR